VRVRVQGDGGGPSEALLWRLKGKQLRLACADRVALESPVREAGRKRGLWILDSWPLAIANCKLQPIGRRADLSPITSDALDAYPSLTEMHISREDEEQEHKLTCQIGCMLMLQCQQLYLYITKFVTARLFYKSQPLGLRL
jgi:hypothetical protein